VLGNSNTVNGAGSVALGSTNSVSGTNSFVLGSNVKVTGNNSVVLGAGSDGSLSNVVSVGAKGAERRVVNVATGQADTDAVNVAQLNTAIASNPVKQDPATSNITVGATLNGSKVDFAGAGGARVLTGVAAGSVSASSVDAINGAQLAGLSQSVASALGGGAGMDATGAITAPTYTINGSQVRNVGDALTSIDVRVIQNTNAITSINTKLTDWETNGGPWADNVHYDSSAHDKLTLGKEGQTALVTNLTDATLSDTSTDAVTGRQLFATNTKVDALTQSLRNFSLTGDSGVAIGANADGSSPTATATGTAAVALGSGAAATGSNASAYGSNTVASAADSSALGSGAKATASKATAVGTGAQATGNNSVALGAGSVADQDNTVSVGSVGSERRVINMAPGVNGTDGANINQLNTLRNDLGSSIASVQRSAFAGVAAAMAMPNLTPREPGKTIVAAGVGNYKGYSAVAASATYRSRDGAWLVNGGLSVTPHGDTGLRAQVGYEF
jgi:autotransporter adhesin